jgi:TfoX/Sxy family transcriptional regulator of competence genes
MAYDELLAHRVRELLADEGGLSEVAMFGGLAFTLDGNISVALYSRGGLLVRVGQDALDASLARPHASVARMGSRTMKGWVLIAPEGLATRRRLSTWVRKGVAYARAMPPKR